MRYDYITYRQRTNIYYGVSCLLILVLGFKTFIIDLHFQYGPKIWNLLRISNHKFNRDFQNFRVTEPGAFGHQSLFILSILYRASGWG